MNEELRAMTLSMAVEWAKSQTNWDPDPDGVIEAAKKFQRHIEFGTGLS